MTVRPHVAWEYSTTTKYNKVATGEVTSPTATIAFVEYMRDQAAPAGLESAMNRLAADMQAWARANHGWRNRTGDAEAGLSGSAEVVNDKTFVARLTHGPLIDYAVYLERDPRLSVIDKTQALFGPKSGEYAAREIELELRGRGSKFRHRGTGRFA